MRAERGRQEGRDKHSFALQIQFARSLPLRRGGSGIRRSLVCGADPHITLGDPI